MYVEIKENKLLSWCENPYLDYEFVDINYSTFDPDKYEIQNNQLIDISQTQEYIAEQTAKENAIKKVELQNQIDELEKSQPRAIREIALNKSVDFAMGKLQSIDEQIQDLRTQINEIGE